MTHGCNLSFCPVCWNETGHDHASKQGKYSQRPESPTPADQLAAERTERHTEDIGEHPAAQHQPERTRTRRGPGCLCGHDRADCPERPGCQGSEKASCKQYLEASANPHNDVTDGE